MVAITAPVCRKAARPVASPRHSIVPRDQGHFRDGPEALLVGLARDGDRGAFAELVRRRQSWIRNLMRRFSGDSDLADDLAQQVFLQAWRTIPNLRQPAAFAAWLRRLAVSTWLQHLRKSDTLRDADQLDDTHLQQAAGDVLGVDLDRALATLPEAVRLCIVLSYHDGMTHGEIADLTELPLGTVKSHIRRGTQQMRQVLSAYRESSMPEQTP